MSDLLEGIRLVLVVLHEVEHGRPQQLENDADVSAIVEPIQHLHAQVLACLMKLDVFFLSFPSPSQFEPFEYFPIILSTTAIYDLHTQGISQLKLRKQVFVDITIKRQDLTLNLGA